MKTKFNGIFTLLLALVVQISFAQERTISGIVSDESGPLPGVSVLKKGTTQGVETNFNGNYSISAKAGDVLVFSFIGMKTTEKIVGASNKINVSLIEDNVLDEVVVTALGIKRQEKSLGYAVSKIGNESIEKSAENNIVQSLAGKAAGIQVIGSGGTPGASSKIIIRGSASISGKNQPLIVVDGVPFDNSTNTTNAGDNPFNANLSGVNNSNRALDINPDDIASVTILKGPAAAALYGARAGNGVILYTTKKGSQGFGISLSIKTTFDKVSKLPELQSTYAQGNNGVFSTADPGPDLRYRTGDDISAGTSNSWGPLISATPGLKSYDNTNDFFRTGFTTDISAAFFGGDEKRTYRASLSRLEQEGIIPNTKLNRITARFTGSNNFSDKFDVSTNISYTRTSGIKAQNGSNLAGIMLGLTRAPASFNLSDYLFGNGNQKTYFFVYDNPYYTANRNTYTDFINRVTGNIKFNYKAHKWANLNLTGAVDTYTDNNRQIYSVSSFGDDNTTGNGQVNYGTTTNSEYYFDLISSGSGEVLTDLNFNYSLGFNITSQFFESKFSRGRGFAVPRFFNLSNASNLYSSNRETKQLTQAIFSQLEFGYKDYLFLTLTGRNEWSSTYGSNNNNAFFPSASLSWVPSSMFKMPDWLNYTKIRAAYSEVGIAPPVYRTNTSYTQATVTDGFTNGLSFPYNGQNGFGIQNSLGNTNLRPEVVKGYEFGLELGFLQSRINFSGTYYNQRTVDMLLFSPTPAESGFTSKFQNGAELENKGLELELNADIIKNTNFNWALTANWSQNKSKVLKLADNVDEVSVESAFQSIGGFAIVGQPLGALFGTKWERDSNDNLIIDQSTGLPTIAGKTGNVGDPNPDWTMGIRNTFTYKNFSLSALLDIREGGDVWNGTFARLNRLGRTQESADRERMYIIPGVTPTGEANTKEIDANTYYNKFVGDNGGAAEQFVQDGGWIRLRDISLSYNFKPDAIKYIKNMELSFGARNLWLKTNYKGVDPETSLTGAGSNLNGFDYFNNPGTKSYTLGLKLQF